MSFKQNVINDLTLSAYHNLNNISNIREIEKTTKVYLDIIKSLNKAKLTQNDVMNLLKHLTLNIIAQCNTHYIEDKEKQNKKQFQTDLK